MKSRHSKHRPTYSVVLTLIVMATVTAVFSGCSGDTAQPDAQKVRSETRAVVEVDVAEVELIDHRPVIRSTCTLVAERRIMFSALAAGNIEKLPVTIGERVREGELLFQTRTTDYRLAVTQAEANVNRAEAAMNNRLREKNRAENLYKAGSVTEQHLDQAVFALDEARASLKQAEAALAIARQALDDCTVTAPFNGVVTGRYIEEDEYRVPGDPVIEVMDLNTLESDIQIPERYAGRTAEGQPVTLTFEDRFDARETSVETVNPKIDLGTRTFSLKIRVDNTAQQLPSGLFARAEIHLPVMESVQAVPVAAVLRDEGSTFVWKVEDGKAHKTSIREVGRTEEHIITQNTLKPGDKLVVSGMGGLTEGVQVEVKSR